MSTSPTEVAVREALAQHGRLTTSAMDLGVDDNLYQAGLTSHASVNVMMAIEDRYDVEFPEHLLKRSTFETIANLRDALDAVVNVAP